MSLRRDDAVHCGPSRFGKPQREGAESRQSSGRAMITPWRTASGCRMRWVTKSGLGQERTLRLHRPSLYL